MSKEKCIKRQKRRLYEDQLPAKNHPPFQRAENYLASNYIVDNPGIFTGSIHQSPTFQRNQYQNDQSEQKKDQDLSYEHHSDWWDVLMAEAIEQIPQHEKTGYINALAKCPPHIRYSDADPIAFIEYENCNVWAAAKRLVNYWEWRVLLFGETKAYQSISDIRPNERQENADKCCGVECSANANYSGTNSSWEEFLKMVEDQGIVVLPQRDAEGNYVMLADISRFHNGWETEMDSTKILRILLYNYTIVIKRIGTTLRKKADVTKLTNTELLSKMGASTNERYSPRSRKANSTFVFLFVSSRVLPKNLESNASNGLDLLQDAVPAQLARIHLFFISDDSNWTGGIQNVTNTMLSVTSTIYGYMALVIPHVSLNKADIVEHLFPYGIVSEMIPPSIGGSWQYPKLSLLKSEVDCDVDTTSQELELLYAGQQQDQVSIRWQTLLDDFIGQIPFHEKTAYMNALIKCPLDVRNREANPLVFVEFEEYNIVRAARRLVNYWEWRLRVFGEFMAYESILNVDDDDVKRGKNLPVNKPDPSTMVRKEFRKLVQDQGITLLPQTTTDGNHVFVIDRYRFHCPIAGVEQFLRVALYNLTLLIHRIDSSRTVVRTEYRSISDSYNDKANKIHNIVALAIVYAYKGGSQAVASELKKIILEAAPVRLVGLHLLFIPKVSSWNRLVQVIAPTVVTVMGKILSIFTSIATHLCFNEADALQKLLPYGFQSNMLPPSLGGTWQYPTKTSLSTSLVSTSTVCSNQLQIVLKDTTVYTEHKRLTSANCIYQDPCTTTQIKVGQNEAFTNGPLKQQQETPVQHPLQDTWHPWNKLFFDAIEQIPYHEKTGYLGAVMHCPVEIWSGEANPLVFVEYEDGNMRAAAKRFVQYWEWRVLIFGEPMAYQSILQIPMIGTGHANDANNSTAMAWNEFWKFIEYQILVTLPHLDLNGNFVFVYDISRFPSDCDAELDPHQLLRIFLFNLTILMQISSRMSSFRATGDSTHNIERRKSSFVIVNVIHIRQHYTCDFTKDMRDMLHEAIPARFVRVHMLFVASYPLSLDSAIQNVVTPVVTSLQTLLRQNVEIIPHVGIPTDLIRHLIPYGLTSEMVPSSIGGTWQYPTKPESTVSGEIDAITAFKSRPTIMSPVNFMTNIETLIPNRIQTTSLAETRHSVAFSSSLECESEELVNDCELEESVNAKFYQIYRWYNNLKANTSSLSTDDADTCSIVDHQKRYWDKRRELFKDRSIRVLSDKFTGNGALSKDDIITLNTNFICVLPSTKKEGHFLLILNLAKAQTCSHESQRRCFFYSLDQLLQFMLRNTSAHTTEKKADPEYEAHVTSLVFVDEIEDATGSTGTSVSIANNKKDYPISFVDVQKSFPIDWLQVHALLQKPTMGWLAHQESARFHVMRLLDVQDENRMLEMHTSDGAHPKRISSLICHGIFNQATIIQAILEHESELRQNEIEATDNSESACSRNNDVSVVQIVHPTMLLARQQLKQAVPNIGQTVISSAKQQQALADYWRQVSFRDPTKGR